jgi:FSR family fosmidomycin resistance protein-like MFS transporter
VVTLAYQLTASILQPLVGLYADKRPTPMALPGGTLFSLAGLVVLSVAHSYPHAAGRGRLLGMGSSVFHPESSRVARMAAGGRFGLAQSLFQVGGNAGSALGRWLRRWSWCAGASRAWPSSPCWPCCRGILWQVANWYRTIMAWFACRQPPSVVQTQRRCRRRQGAGMLSCWR